MAGLSTNAPGLWGGFAGLLYGSTSLSTPPGFLADATPAWVPDGGVLAFEFDNGLGYNSRNLATTTPDSILTYTSPSPKLVYGDDGVLRYAPHNFIRYSQEFDNATWTKNGVTVSANSVAAPDGTTTADTLTADAGTGTIPRVADVSTVTANGAVHTASIYAKAGTYSFVQIYLNNQGADWVNFTLSGSGTASANGSCTATITALSGGWYRLTMTYTAGSTDRRPFFMLAASGTATRAQSWNPAGTESIYIWGAQLNLGSSALTYIPTTTAAVYSLPIDHNPTTFDPLGVLIEEQRTNLLTYSEQFNDAAWSRIQNLSTVPTVVANAAIAPDGTMTADEVNFGVIDGADDASVIRQGITATSAVRIGEIWLKAKTAGDIGKTLHVYINNAGAVVDRVAHVLTANWTRVASSGLTAIVDPLFSVGALGTTYGGANQAACGAHLWGAQLEVGAFPTSYIPTVASQVTRAADQVSILTSAFGYSATASTLVAAGDSPGISGAANIITVDDGTANERIRLLTDVLDPKIIVTDGGVAQANIDTGAIVALQPFAMSAAYALNDIAACLNGGTVGTDIVATIPTVTTLRVGFDNVGNHLNGHIKRLTYFPTRRTNADLQVLST